MQLIGRFLFTVLLGVCLCKNTIERNLLDKIFNLHYDPDASRNVSELISSKGYPVENYDVQTKDGYILSVQRIRHGKYNYRSLPKKKEVVFLQHGLLSSATDWVINFENESLGFILADAGYDVWLGNIRGNTYSRRHVKLTPNMRAFWNFSFDQMGQYDLPAMIDFILNATCQKQLFYIGHSQGTTAAFALLSENPEYNKKIKLMVALAPVATVGYITTAIHYLAPFAWDFELLFTLFGVDEFLPNSAAVKYLAALVCDTRIKAVCENIIFLLCGTDLAQLNETRLYVYVSHTPAGASTQSLIHYAQMINTKKFQKYDYGTAGNKLHYNQTEPLLYNVSKITTPVALFWSRNDKLADPIDVGILENSLPSLVSSTCVRDPFFNHLDFVWGLDAPTVLYKQVLSLLQR